MVNKFKITSCSIFDYPKEPAGNGKHPRLVRYEKIVPVLTKPPSTRAVSIADGVISCEVFIRKHKLSNRSK